MAVDEVNLSTGSRISYDGDEFNIVGRIIADGGTAFLVVSGDPQGDDHVPDTALLISESAAREHGEYRPNLTPGQRQAERDKLQAQIDALNADDKVVADSKDAK